MNTVLLSLSTALLGYLFIGFWLGKKNRALGDLLPLAHGREASVRSHREFSASTIATSISLATVILAFFELAPLYGVWLFWCVITTSLGLFLMRMVARQIWDKMSAYDHRPTLHEFLGTEYGSSAVYRIGAVCTSLGFLGAFAVELTVGSRFLAALVPQISMPVAVTVLAFIGLAYTAYGGFRAVIITDRIQMVSIWLMLFAILAFYIVFAEDHGGWTYNFNSIPSDIRGFRWHDQLPSFLLGIFVINVPTFIADMSVWQRIAASQKPETVFRGLFSSVAGSALSWSFFVIIACLAMIVIVPVEDVNPLLSIMQVMTRLPEWWFVLLVFLITLGLYGAMLSTASTQLVAVAHTLYEDLIARFRKMNLKERVISPAELQLSRWILVLSALAAMAIVLGLTYLGFSISDFVFAIYGTQLGLCTPILAALYWPRERLQTMGVWAGLAIASGFLMGWSSAAYGKWSGNGDLIFLAPVISFGVSTLIFGAGLLFTKLRSDHV